MAEAATPESIPESIPVARRIAPLEGRHSGRAGLRLDAAPPAARLSLRAGESARDGLTEALGLALPARINTSAQEGGLAALCLGPDEWLLIGADGEDLAARLAWKTPEPFSAVDVSHRNTAVLLAGPLAAVALNSGCPRDLREAAFPVGACARTLLGKAEIVLWRTGESAWRIECWRSFSDYVWRFLVDAARSAA